jgi:hypothetical protein
LRENFTYLPIVMVSERQNDVGRRTEMPGIQVFKTLADALRAGYHVYDRTEHGYLVRTRTASGWAMAVVTCR